jgi:periplasmic protein TonB
VPYGGTDGALRQNRVGSTLSASNFSDFKAMLSQRTDSMRRGERGRQQQKVLLATLLVLVAVAIILVKDRHFWFGADEVQDDEQVASESAPSTPPQTPTAPANPVKKHVAEKTAAQAPAEPMVTASNRTAVPPLDVEVVSGDNHQAVHPGSNSIKVEIPVTSKSGFQGSTGMGATRNAGTVTAASARERIPNEQKFQSAGVEYPMLTPQSRVQGSVVLQARIGADGVVEDLRVVSGPAILASAAREAVKRWQFKPYIQNGQAVETVANITVNFTIKVAGNPDLAS